MQEEPKLSRNNALIERIMLAATEQVPRELFDPLTPAEVSIWLTEPDPKKFPPSMARLRDWLLYK